MNLDLLKENFFGKKIFITGHTGFKGSWLTYLLTELGAQVAGFALPPKGIINNFDILNLEKKITHIEGNICDFKSLNEAISEFNPEFCFHLAAQALVKESYKNPIETLQTNVIGSANLLESIRNLKQLKSLVFITSDKCYENYELNSGYREDDRLGGVDPYSASKASAEIIFSSYYRSFLSSKFDLGAATARAGNVIGGGDWSIDRIVPDCIRSIQDFKTLKLRNPNSTRPWQHVLEPLSGYLNLAIKLHDNPKEFSSAWNFGPNEEQVKSVKEVAEQICKHFNYKKIEIEKNLSNHHEANLLQLNCDKSKNFLNWHPKWNFKKTIDVTAQWYKFVIDGGDPEEITNKQIKEYFL